MEPSRTSGTSTATSTLPSFAFRAPLSLDIFSVSLTLLPREDIRIIDNYYRSRYYRTWIFSGCAELTIVRARTRPWTSAGLARVIERIQYRFSNVRLSLTGSRVSRNVSVLLSREDSPVWLSFRRFIMRDVTHSLLLPSSIGILPAIASSYVRGNVSSIANRQIIFLSNRANCN